MLLVDVLEEHLDEAEFRWLQWERALEAPDFTLEETATREERLLAHLEALEDESALDTVLRPAFDSEEALRVSAATYALLGLGQVDEVLVRLRGAEAPTRAAILRALEVSEAPGLAPRLLELLKLEDTGLQAGVLETLAFRQEAPVEVLARFFTHDKPRARVAALRGAPSLPEETARRHLPALLDSAHPGIRAAAMEAGLASGVQLAWEACRKAVQAPGAHTREAMVLLALGGDEAEAARLVDLLESAELRAHALWALGFSGQVVAMEACVKHLAVPDVARLAGEALSAMTGLRLESAYALPPGERLEDAPVPPEEQESPDADLTPRPEDDLPWPDVAAVKDWWAQNRARFAKGTRYLQGQPFSGPVLVEALGSSPMRRRHVLARELTIRTRGQHRIPTRAFTHHQHEALARAKATAARVRAAPLASTLR
ncbi:TIGR02270 family protein [Myxococcus xanthus]|uniref:TIGR02270 family protein n=1 Tax=Myxococcus xanthus TaxID=34 RepID=A0A7Y4MT75_MYXXA|nr:TIGR02270 family protein [Myxococcus xanthus]NOJ81836.1 TIGR02270 family protein [Myxococcus xanthus]NOJ86965.1 TIGR02270 family protein [Myxococcus xanthus]